MSDRFTVACVQTNTGPEIEPNLAVVAPLIRDARAAGAALICLPETVAMMEPDPGLRAEKAEPEASHRALAALRASASETGAWILVGSLTVETPSGGLANRSYLIGADGEIVARYDKIHMFDVDLADGESHRESDIYDAGDRTVLAATPWGTLGLTVCYDVRFPELYRDLAKAGARFLTVPSAFTHHTGSAHWHVLLRARAIETGCFVFAPAQCGRHAGGRRTFGHSLVVSPWGEVLADGGTEPGLSFAEIDPALVDAARRQVPSLRHDRPYQRPGPTVVAATTVTAATKDSAEEASA